MQATAAKANGIHYTPEGLADFLAHVTLDHAPNRPIRVLDPACGNGVLLAAFARALPESGRAALELFGYDTDPHAARQARHALGRLGVASVAVEEADFIELATPETGQRHLFDDGSGIEPTIDVVISNPPYVRTQVLGSSKAQSLAQRFSLTGRVDLYHAFTVAMASTLRPGGTIGLLTSNRFLTIRSGSSLRKLLSNKFDLKAIYDLGDTRLFTAAVLPVIVVARKAPPTSACRFDRVYEYRKADAPKCGGESASVLHALRDAEVSGLVRTPSGTYKIERGFLAPEADGGVWSLGTTHNQGWLAAVRRSARHKFDDVARIRVGIKTTADEVFIRENWCSLPESERPESRLIRPLIRHCDASRWRWSGKSRYEVLYPYANCGVARTAIDLRQFPRANQYFEAREARLKRRHYLTSSGRKWFEIWVPHDPKDWSEPKIVFPDISEEPRFFFDASGAIVNGDCYWITLREGANADYLFLILAVANSTFITRYYDIAFHNKLYSGRRRFMTQYVKKFPLPRLDSKFSQQAIAYVKQAVNSPTSKATPEGEIDDLVWRAFDLRKEVGG